MTADDRTTQGDKRRLLIYEPSFQTVRDAVMAYGDVIETILIDSAGNLALAGRAVSVAEACPHLAWASGDLFESAAARDFLQAVLKSPCLDWVQSGAAGFDHPIFGQIVGKGARLTTSHGQSVGMADYVMAGVLDHFQNGPARRAAQSKRDWRRIPFREIDGSVWLLVGFGAIGQDIARRASSFGARIIGVRRNPAAHPLADAIVSLDAMHAQLPDADVVVLCMPANNATRRLADGQFFEAMKLGSVLVNVGRGSLVDEPALLRALDRGAPAHAVLDVFMTEPLPEDSLFWDHPSVNVTGHTSGNTGGQKRRNETLFLDNLGRFVRGEPLLGEVDAKDVLDER